MSSAFLLSPISTAARSKDLGEQFLHCACFCGASLSQRVCLDFRFLVVRYHASPNWNCNNHFRDFSDATPKQRVFLSGCAFWIFVLQKKKTREQQCHSIWVSVAAMAQTVGSLGPRLFESFWQLLRPVFCFFSVVTFWMFGHVWIYSILWWWKYIEISWFIVLDPSICAMFLLHARMLPPEQLESSVRGAQGPQFSQGCRIMTGR